ncbi:DUF3310 domain-containing protein [Rhodococcus ruber]|uniref:DUF3310 domain-containing protein n=1 Tax=Rhodococcus ruber TaxID=1830 RepID=UPI00177DD399|nr:DUF3310 domain-containing protein [Rhodococcus ruber]MBD8056929.1 DUF3310 domain-containing protein [Rhodococcus ruber]
MTDMVNAPDHYRGHASGVECIDIAQHMTFCAGNAMKYIYRRNDKWNTLEDTKKALWYLTRHMEQFLKFVWLPEFESEREGKANLLRVIEHEPKGHIHSFYVFLYHGDVSSAAKQLMREIARLEAIAS